MSRYHRVSSANPGPSLENEYDEAHEGTGNERDRLVEAFCSDDDDDEVGPYDDDRNLSFITESHSGSNHGTASGRSSPLLAGPSSGTSATPAASTSASVSTSVPSGGAARLPPLSPSSASSSSPSSAHSRAYIPSFLSTLFGGSRLSSQSNGPQANNDGVFANIVAKPSAEKPDDETEVEEPPSYEVAAADQAPPYWETTILAPGMSDEPFIDGLPVGSLMNFFWNMIVSSAFQFVGFFLTYLLHTSHAAKQGSRAGLGFTLVQCGFYLKPGGSGLGGNGSGDSGLGVGGGGGGSGSGGSDGGGARKFEPSDPNNFDVAAYSLAGTFDGENGHGSSTQASSSDEYPHDNTNWVSTALMVVGALIIIKAVVDYFQARRMERALIRSASAAASNEDGSERTSEDGDNSTAATTNNNNNNNERRRRVEIVV